jgi:hypothetical protein
MLWGGVDRWFVVADMRGHACERQDVIIKLAEEHAASGLPVGLDVNSGDTLSPEMAGIWCVGPPALRSNLWQALPG